MSAKVALKMTGISKEYYGNRVLDNVDLVVGAGEICALMGENGAGKSTLMNILYGMPVIHNTGGYEGTIEINEQPVVIDSPQKAMELGIGMVHQEFMLIPGFTVTENIKLGREDTTPTVLSELLGKNLEKLNYEKMQKDAQKALGTIGLNIEDHVRVKGLPVGYKQFIEIARELDKQNLSVLVFDEPTAVLTESEAERLLGAMKTIAEKGIAIIFITHRLDEIFAVSDSITILRDGKLVEHVATKDTNAVDVAEKMIGRKIDKLLDEKKSGRDLKDDDIILSLRDFYVEMPGERVKGVDLDVRRGEIFGIGGLAGQGKVGIANGIIGLFDSSGEVTFNEKPLNMHRLGAALRAGIGFVSEDRRGVGLLLDESIEQNINFSAMRIKNKYLTNLGFAKIYNRKKGRAHAMRMIEQLDIRCINCKQAVGRLSGGNQQKVCLARALSLEPELLIVAEPTRGIDIGAKKLVMELLSRLNQETGMTIIMVSSELVELRSLCDRIAIVSEGKVTAIMSPDAKDADYGLAMAGEKLGGE